MVNGPVSPVATAGGSYAVKGALPHGITMSPGHAILNGKVLVFPSTRRFSLVGSPKTVKVPSQG